jgi:hypothetical protein
MLNGPIPTSPNQPKMHKPKWVRDNRWAPLLALNGQGELAFFLQIQMRCER